MKKIFSLLTITSLVLSISGCSSQTTSKCEFNIGLVTDSGGIDDKSFNQGTWEGLERLSKDNPKICVNYAQSNKESDYITNLSAMADQKKDLIVAPGFTFQSAMLEVSKNYPDQQFLLIDTDVPDNGKQAPNVASAIFAEHEGSFLVGVAAGLKAKEMNINELGFIGGMEGPIIKRFETGFVQGVKAVDPKLEVVIEYAGTFRDAAIGKTIANKLYDNGVGIIYQAAAGTGNGVIAAAKERALKGEQVYVVGVDRDQYEDGIYNDKNDSIILTSMVKGVDVAGYDVANREYNDESLGGQVLTYNLKNNGVGLPKENPNLSDDIIKQVEAYQAKIKSGEIVVADK